MAQQRRPYYRSLAPLVAWAGDARRPIDWTNGSGRRPLDLEIGFGRGEWLIRLAAESPGRRIIGLELEWESVKRALRRIDQARLTNVSVALVDARVALERLIAPASLSRVFALFPCPWPKEKHAKYRLFSREFLELLNSRLEPGGVVLLVTDSRPYLDWVLGETPGSGFEAGWQTNAPRFDTGYERKWSRQGQTRFYELRLRKTARLDARLKEDVPLHPHLVSNFDPERFSPEGARGEVTVEFKEFLYDAARRKGLARATVVEDRFVQEFWIELAGAPDGWHIRPAQGCRLVPTRGVQLALDLAREAALRTAA
ncbi:MAG TPA: hypothetical protein VGB20_00995 [bacterium]